ncbi:hypothetical protein B0H16DRAFT_1687477 [Mycena metata]|uniref:Zn(2)-C6 fungal-type domain-containing protein n=1 Tax=Mycena metata TaxID=1033252 RepID=A0AAD7NL42_9AGAR|nr:hypothetical protein B0H16DRAFT_1687477 [Mycena metata]
MSNPSPPQIFVLRRKRADRACKNCRKRKVRCIPSDDSAQDICARCLKKGLVCEYTPVTAEEDGAYTNPPAPTQQSMPFALPPGNVARNNQYSSSPGTPGRPLQSPPTQRIQHTHRGPDPSYNRSAYDGGGWNPQYPALYGGQPMSHYAPGALASSSSTGQTPHIQGHSNPENAWYQPSHTPFPCWCLANPCYCGGLRR